MFPFKKKQKALPKSDLPKIKTKVIPGPKSVQWTESLKRYECPQITYVGEHAPIFFEKAHGCNLIDADGNKFLDMTSAFAVSSIGHAPPTLTRVLVEQSKQMIHGLGDVHPNSIKVKLAKKLSEITPGNLSMTIFSSTGAEAVETALKTAVMVTKKSGVIAFTGAYHGLGYGALQVTHREDFKKPFLKQLGAWVYTAPYPDERIYENQATNVSMKAIEGIVSKARKSKHPVGAIIIEPIQGRGGVIAAPLDFLKKLRTFCDQEKIVLIADEVFTGFGRTGSLFAVDKASIVPDLLCLGKGMAGGFPLSACIGATRTMYAWGSSTGEALHTSTFLGHPLGCAAALAVIQEIETHKLVERSKSLGESFRKELWKLKEKYPVIGDIRGSGLMIGIEFMESKTYNKKGNVIVPATDKAAAFSRECLKRGLVLLRCGPASNVISLTPPLIISDKELSFVIKTFDKVLKDLTKN